MNKELLKNLALPVQLKNYLLNTKMNYKNLTDDGLLNVEEAYLYYDSLYYLDDSQFSELVIEIIKKDFSSTNFNYRLMNILKKKLELTSKNIYSHTFDSISSLEFLFDQTAMDFIDNLQEYKFNDTIPDAEIYKKIGKLELINAIVNIDYYKTILKDGIDILGSESK